MSTAPDTAKTSRLGGVSTGFWLVLLALSVIVFGLNTGVATWQGSRLAGAGTGAADLQVLSQQLANQGRDAVSGNAEAFKDFRQTKAQIESTVSDLQGRFGAEPGVSGQLRQLVEVWTPLGESAAQIVASEPAVLALAGNADRFAGRVPQLQAQLNEVVRAMTAGGAPASQVFSALQQVVGCSWMVRPFAAVVHRCLNGQARQAMPNTALRVLVMVFVTPAGQVRVPAAGSWVKSSMVNPSSTAGRIGQGLTSGTHLLASRTASMSPVA